MTDGQPTEPEAVVVRWTLRGLHWGLHNADVHGLGDELQNRIADLNDEDGGDERATFIIYATEERVADAIAEVNMWVGNRPHGDLEAMDADDFQKALAYPWRR
jgi:hypothetical protein